MTRYINTKTNFGTETWETICSSEFESVVEFRAEIKKIINSYSKMGYRVYVSQKKAK